MINPFTQFFSALSRSHSKPHFHLGPDGVSKAKRRSNTHPRPLLCKAIHCLCNPTALLFPRLGSLYPQASLHPFTGLSQATPTWPDCNLSADLLERQKQNAQVEADRVKEGYLLLRSTASARLSPRKSH